MSNALNSVFGDVLKSGGADRADVAAREKSRGGGDRACCFHCGEVCPDSTFSEGEKTFCCQGCLTVHDLLAENGLEQFYDLARHPGLRVRGASGSEQWRYLDEPGLQRRLLDFTDGKHSRVTLHLPAIHCVACVWLLENLFRLHPGIGRSQVNFARREVTVDFATDQIRLSELVALLASIGYEPALTLGEPGTSKPNRRASVCGFNWASPVLPSATSCC